MPVVLGNPSDPIAAWLTRAGREAGDMLAHLPEAYGMAGRAVGSDNAVVRWARDNPLDAAALAVAPVPVLGDVAGLANDLRHYATEPESRTLGNAALTALGVLPFIPAMAGVVRGVDTASAASRADAAKGIRLGSDPAAAELDISTPARMARAREMGFDVGRPVYHGTAADIPAFDVSRTGDIGVHFGSAEQADAASRNA